MREDFQRVDQAGAGAVEIRVAVGGVDATEFLGAADLYVTPYLSEEQIVSGTLAYAMGAGKAIVSTPYFYAREMLADGRGRLVPFGDADATAAAIVELLDDETARHAMRKRAYTFARANVWSAVARRYLDIVEDVTEERSHQPRPARAAGREPFETFPELDFAHLRRSDEQGEGRVPAGEMAHL